jgi:phosphate-selective porin OprO/OprP
MNSLRRHIAIFLLTGLGILQVPAQDTVSIKFSPIKYGNKGFELRDAVGNNLMHLEFRGQFRLAYPTDTDPITENDFQDEKKKALLKFEEEAPGQYRVNQFLGETAYLITI